MHTRCHHIILSTSIETADLSVSLHNWGAVGIKDVTLRGMRKCYPRPPPADLRTQLEWEPQTGCIHRPETVDRLPHSLWSQRPRTYTCDWCVRSAVMWQNSTLKRNQIFSSELSTGRAGGQFSLISDTSGNGLRFSSRVGNETKLITDGSIDWPMNKSPLLTNQN